MKKKIFSMHVDVEDFLPASAEEKAYMVQMRPSTTFFKDGVKRLLKNKIATLSLIVIVLVTLAALVIPSFWPYSYDAMLGINPAVHLVAPKQIARSEGKAVRVIDKRKLV